MDELALYDRTRARLRELLSAQISDPDIIEEIIISSAYWVCSVVRDRGTEWAAAVDRFASRAVRDAEHGIVADRRELESLQRALRDLPSGSTLLDVGAGWGRVDPLYRELRLHPTYVEPATLGTKLIARSGARSVARAVGERLPFSTGSFAAVVIGWVLHHSSEHVDPPGILQEVARVLTPGGRLVSVEPLSADFDLEQWQALITREDVGIQVLDVDEFYQMPDGHGGIEYCTLLSGVLPMSPN